MFTALPPTTRARGLNIRPRPARANLALTLAATCLAVRSVGSWARFFVSISATTVPTFGPDLSLSLSAPRAFLAALRLAAVMRRFLPESFISPLSVTTEYLSVFVSLRSSRVAPATHFLAFTKFALQSACAIALAILLSILSSFFRAFLSLPLPSFLRNEVNSTLTVASSTVAEAFLRATASMALPYVAFDTVLGNVSMTTRLDLGTAPR